MAAAERLESLLARHVERRLAGGDPPDPVDLCRDAPELLRRLQDLIRDFESLAHGLEVAADTGSGLAPRSALAPGSRLADRFEIIDLVGSGGMGEVYRARDRKLGRQVAIKVLHAGFAADPERLKRFEREARATAALSHPNILAVHDVGTEEATPYLVEELLEGESLEERVRRGPCTVAESLRIAVEIARGLAAAHEKGIVHRDLKPGNVFLTRDGRVKLLDFGLAKLALAGGDADTTALGAVLGTVAYMAPEQARGLAVDARTDVFAFGVLLYEMLAGRRPFRGATASDTVAAILRDEPPTLPAGLPRGVTELVMRCLSKEPESRYQQGGELHLALERLQPVATATVFRRGQFVAPRRPRLPLPAPAAAAVAADASYDVGAVL